MREPWEIRRASLHDRDELAALCEAAVAPDDYVIDRLEDLILLGVVNVALDGERIVGMMHYSPAIDGSAWLRAARTHPDHRRRGVAGALLDSFAVLGSRSGVLALRLWSSASNEAGNASAKASGFHEVARFSRVKGRTEKGSERAARIAFSTELVSEVQDAPLLRLAGGYIPYDRAFVRLVPATIHLLANAGALYRIAGGIVVFSAHPEEDPMASLDFGLAAGDAAQVLVGIRAAALALGLESVHAYLPFDRAVLGAATEAGFEPETWGQEAVLFERTLDVRPTSYRKRRTYAEIAAGKREGYAALGLLAGKHGHDRPLPHEDRWNP